jgi:hypothetical protein
MRSAGWACLIVLLLATTAQTGAASAAPTPPPERRHASGIVLLPPADRAADLRGGPIDEPLGKAWSDARQLAEQYPSSLGHPWADRANRQLIVRVVDAQGEAVANSWIASGARRTVFDKSQELLKPVVPVRLQRTDRSFALLESIKDGAIGKGALGFDGDSRIWTSHVDEPSERVVLETDRVVDAYLYALAKAYGTAVVAVRVDPRSGPFGSIGASFDLRAAAAPPDIARQLGIAGGAALSSTVALGLAILALRRRRAPAGA